MDRGMQSHKISMEDTIAEHDGWKVVKEGLKLVSLFDRPRCSAVRQPIAEDGPDETTCSLRAAWGIRPDGKGIELVDALKLLWIKNLSTKIVHMNRWFSHVESYPDRCGCFERQYRFSISEALVEDIVDDMLSKRRLPTQSCSSCIW